LSDVLSLEPSFRKHRFSPNNARVFLSAQVHFERRPLVIVLAVGSSARDGGMPLCPAEQQARTAGRLF
jgi:hypothetical protein